MTHVFFFGVFCFGRAFTAVAFTLPFATFLGAECPGGGYRGDLGLIVKSASSLERVFAIFLFLGAKCPGGGYGGDLGLSVNSASSLERVLA